jgi:alpha-glucosidase
MRTCGKSIEQPDAVVVDLHSPSALEVRRGEALTLILAMGNAPVRLPAGRLLLASGPPTSDGRLPPDTTAWLRR